MLLPEAEGTGPRGVAAIALGSNLHSSFGDREANLREAVRRVGSLGSVRAVSRFHDTSPVGLLEQPRFLNGALLLETTMRPEGLLDALLSIERGMGRDRALAVEKGPRVIDLDLLLYGDEVLSSARLRLPHPAMHTRAFVLEPMAEIAPEMVHPMLGRTISELLDALPGQSRPDTSRDA